MDISILIVDDDKLVVEKLVEGVNWKQLGIGIVLTAYNIRQAKEILEEARVDILLSDIEMPQGSGLELLEWVRNKEIPVECIFLSSYAYFAYAQKAIKTGFQQRTRGGAGKHSGDSAEKTGRTGRRGGQKISLLGEVSSAGKLQPVSP